MTVTEAAHFPRMNHFDPRSPPRGVVPPDFVAANDDYPPVRVRRLPGPVLGPIGWDPFEIWRTRVRDARQDAGPSRLG